MRIFGIKSDNTFSEYIHTPFQVDHEETVLENGLENNPDGIVEDGKLLIIGRQVTTNLGSYIDLLALDRKGDAVVIELKRDKTPRDTLAQALEYASFTEQLDSQQLEDILRTYLNDESLNLAEYHRQYFEIASDEAVTFNKDQRIVIVGQKITREIKQTASFLRDKGLNVTCVEFSFFQSEDGTQLLSQEIVVGEEASKPAHVASGSLPIITREEFLQACDENGKDFFNTIFEFAKKRICPFTWAQRVFH